VDKVSEEEETSKIFSHVVVTLARLSHCIQEDMEL
jgi:hypothetical protein